MVDDREEAIVIKVIENMPAGTIGLEASGKVTEEDYRDVLVPTINAATEQGKVRLLYVFARAHRVLRAAPCGRTPSCGSSTSRGGSASPWSPMPTGWRTRSRRSAG